MTYDDWLRLSPEERERTLRSWNPYAGEHEEIPSQALRRLVERSPLPLQQSESFVGVYHCGEYILNPALPPRFTSWAPTWLTTEFEGFRIGYVSADHDCEAELGSGAEAIAALAAELASFGADIYSLSLPLFAGVPTKVAVNDAIFGDVTGWHFLEMDGMQVVWREANSRDRWGLVSAAAETVGDDAWFLTLRDVLIALGALEAPPGYEVP